MHTAKKNTLFLFPSAHSNRFLCLLALRRNKQALINKDLTRFFVPEISAWTKSGFEGQIVPLKTSSSTSLLVKNVALL